MKKLNHLLGLLSLLGLFTIGLFFETPTAQADVGLPSPEVLLTRASKSKNDLRDVINLIDLNVSEFSDAETFDKYFYLFDDFLKLSDKFKLDTIYPQGVVKVAGRMTQRGVNFLNILTDSSERLLYYHKWMQESGVSASFLYSAELQIEATLDYNLITEAVTKTESLCAFIRVKWAAEKSIQITCANLVTDLAAKYLKRGDLAEADILFWISKIYRAEGMQVVLTGVQNSLHELPQEKKAELHSLLKKAQIIVKQTRNPDFVSNDVLNSTVQDLLVEVLVRFVRIEETASRLELETSMGLLSNRHLAALSASLLTGEKAPSKTYAKSYFDCIGSLIRILKIRNLNAEAKQASDSLANRGSALLARYLEIEGLYTLKDKTGKSFYLNFVNTSDDSVAAVFTDAREFTNRTFSYIVYDQEAETFIASDRSSDASSSPNHPLRIKFIKSGQLEVTDFSNEFDSSPMLAKRLQKYPDLMSENEIPNADFTGLYEGNLPTGLQEFTKVELAINAFNGQAIANIKHPFFKATFNSGWEVKSGILYLTRITNAKTIFHIRLKKTPEGIQGWVIIGKNGLVKQPLKMKKIN